MRRNGNRQIVQRVLSGLLAAGGIVSLAMSVVQGDVGGWPNVVSGVLAIGGCYLFGYFTICGRLPGTRLSKASEAIQRATSRQHA